MNSRSSYCELLAILVVLYAAVICPAFSLVTTLQYRLLEELPPPVYLGDISTDSQIVESNPRYSILPSPRLPSWFFYLNETSGALWTNITLDRESICLPRSPECSLQFQATTNTFHIFQITIIIVDTNDNSPKFTRSSTTVTIPEDAKPEVTRFPLPSADDPDSGLFGLQRYVFVPETETFALVNNTGSGGSSEMFLVLKKALDHEVFQSYEFKVIAYDGGVPPKTGQLAISITVIDVNDHAPSFDQDQYNATILKTMSPGEAITRVHAVDSDSGLNGEVIYTVSPMTVFAYGDLFAVTNTSGDLYLTRTIDLLNVNEYSVVIQAEDRGLEPRKNTTTVLIYVRDLQNRAPHINIITQTSSGKAEVMENSPPGTPIAFISTIDPDTDRNEETNCQLLPLTDGSSYFRLNPITSTSYTVVTMTSMDRELRDIYYVAIQCRDQGTPPLSSDRNLTIVVLDQNDNSPRFGRDTYDVTVDENRGVGAQLLVVSAVDSDAGENGNVTYSLLNGTGMMTIGKYSGDIRTVMNLEYIRVKQLEVVVLAKDGGAPTRNSTVIVRITIRNVNDCPPVFSRPSFNFTVLRDQQRGSVLGRIVATDLDQPPYDAFTYSLTDDIGAFSVDSETGEISTARILSKLNDSSFQFIANAVDSWPPYFRATVNVTVSVIDDADEVPRLLFPTDINNTVEVSLNARIGHKITQIIAYSPNLNLTLDYSFLNESDTTNPFEIGHEDGVISVARSLKNREWNAPSAMEIVVANNGEPKLVATAILLILVKNSEMIEGAELQLYHRILIIVLSLTFAIVFLLVTAILVVMKRNQLIGQRLFCRSMNRDSVEEDLDVVQTGNPKDSNGLRNNNEDRYSANPRPQRNQIPYHVQRKMNSGDTAAEWDNHGSQYLKVSIDPRSQGIVERGSDTSSGCSSAGVSINDSGKGPGWADVGSEPVCPSQIQQPQAECSVPPTASAESNRGKLPAPSNRKEIYLLPNKDFIISSFSSAASFNAEIKKDSDIAIYLRELSSQREVFADLPSTCFRTQISQMISFHPNLRKESDISDCSNGICDESKTDSVFSSSDSTVEVPLKGNSQRFPVMTKEEPKDNYSVAPQRKRVRGRSECSTVGWPSVLNKTRSKFTCSKNTKQHHLTAVGLGNTVEINCSEDGASSTSGSFRINMETASGTIFSEIYPSVNV